MGEKGLNHKYISISINKKLNGLEAGSAVNQKCHGNGISFSSNDEIIDKGFKNNTEWFCEFLACCA